MKQVILNAIAGAQQVRAKRSVILENDQVHGKHEFLFFIKPEITQESRTIQLPEVLDMILKKLDEFGLNIKNALLLPAPYLNEHNIIAQHYGIINAIASNAREALSDSAKKEFEQTFKLPVSEAPIFGGLELLEQYPVLTPTGLSYVWQNSPVVKLGGGAYAQALTFDGRELFLVNGFHPRQLDHYISPGRSIVAFTLVGDTDWSEARNALIGKTNPDDAQKGSIRRTLLEMKDELGLQAVTSSWNGVHLSAGPVEGLVELIRYNSDFSNKQFLSYADFSFGQKLAELFDEAIVQRILNNETVRYKGQQESIFDITEEKNVDEALNILQEVF